MKSLSNESIGIAAAIMATFIWASSFIALKFALDTVGPMSIISGRMLIASLMFVFFYKRFLGLSFTKEDVKYMALMVLLEPCLYFVFEIKALQLTTASQAGVITATMPLMTAVAAGVLLGEIITKKLIFGSLLAMIGVIWLSIEASADTKAPDPLLGNFLELLAMVCGAGYAIAMKYLTQKFTPLFLTAIQAFAGAIFYLPLALWEWQGVVPDFEINGFLAIAYLGIVVTMGGYGLFNYSLTKLPASKASAFINLIPVFAIFLAFIVLDERLSFIQLVASGLIFAGVFISQTSVPKRLRRKVRV